MPYDYELTSRRAYGQGNVNEAFPVFRRLGNPRQDGNADAESDQRLNRRDLRAPETNPRLEMVIAAETANLGGQRTGSAHQHEGLVGEIAGLYRGLLSEGMIFADDEQEWLGKKSFDG